MLFTLGCVDSSSPSKSGKASTATPKPSASKPQPMAQPQPAPAPAPPETVSNPSNPLVIIETAAGPIKVELFADKAPITVKNFLAYVDDKFYDGTLFHRVIPTF